MKSCTFFGHRDVSGDIEKSLTEILIDLIENKKISKFYVGNNGNFDRLVRKKLKQIKKTYPHISYEVVLAYIPQKKKEDEDYSDTVFPSALEKVPYIARIKARNEYMINKSKYVVCCIYKTASGAAEAVEKARGKGKIIINIFQ